MQKNKLKIVSLFTLLILVLSTPFVMATEEAQNSEQTEQAQESTAGQETVAEQHSEHQENTEQNTDSVTNQTDPHSLKSSDIYLIGDNITVDYMIDGNLFVIANSLTIDSQIGGDAFICAKDVKITNQGYVYGNVFNMSNNLDIEGTVYDIYTLSTNTTVSGFVFRDLKAFSENINIYGTIRRNAFLNVKNINFKKESSENINILGESKTETEEQSQTDIPTSGIINGNLDYSAPNEISISKDNVSGEINYSQKSENANANNTLQTYLMSLGTLLATILLIWLIGLWLAPKFTNNSQLLLKNKFLPILGFGLLGLVCIPVVSIILLIIGITYKVAFILCSLYAALLGISLIVFISSINNIVCKKLKADKTIAKLGILIICGIIFWALTLIPFVNIIAYFAAFTLGTGTILYYIIKKGNIEESISNEKK